MADLTVLILTHNEQAHIARALENVKPLAKAVIVIDSFSTDATQKIASAKGSTIVEHRFVNQAKQLQWAIDHLEVTTEWVMRLDADEILSPELIAELEVALPRLDKGITGICLRRKHIFLGRWIKHGGRYPITLLRVWRRGTACVEQRWMDEHIILLQGRAVTASGTFSDHNLSGLTEFIDKHNRYATREAVERLLSRFRLAAPSHEIFNPGNKQAAAKRWAKEKLFDRLPIWLGPSAYFAFRYFIQLGFLDGTEGLIYHVLQGFWYRFLVSSKIEEFTKKLCSVSGRDEKIAMLMVMAGIDEL